MQDVTSIIIPCYNAEDTIDRAVESALAQTYPKTEIIVVDDGSTDSSFERLSRFGGVLKIIREINRGGGAARNIGLKAARGEFIQFLDADDELLPEKIERCMDSAKLSDSSYIPVSDWTRKMIESDAPLEQFSFETNEGREFENVLRKTLTTSSPLHRKTSLLAIGGFREHLKCCQEKDLHIRLFVRGFRFARVPFDGVIQYETAGSVSSDTTRVLLQRREVFRNVANLLNGLEPKFEWRKPLACALAVDAFDLINLGCLDSHEANLLLASELDPNAEYVSCIPNRVLRLVAKTAGALRAAHFYALSKRLG